jgi:antirestriction protein ArdC
LGILRSIVTRREPHFRASPWRRLKVLKDDKRAIFTAASHAQKAADYLHGLQPQEAQS